MLILAIVDFYKSERKRFESSKLKRTSDEKDQLFKSEVTVFAAAVALQQWEPAKILARHFSRGLRMSKHIRLEVSCKSFHVFSAFSWILIFFPFFKKKNFDAACALRCLRQNGRCFVWQNRFFVGWTSWSSLRDLAVCMGNLAVLIGS